MLKGFALPELILSLFLFVLVFSIFLVSLIVSSGLNEISRNLTIASLHAQLVMEEIRNSNFLTLKDNINSGQWDFNGVDLQERGLEALNSESIDTEVDGDDLLNILVTVRWKDKGLRDRSFVLQTIMVNL
ncbi:MAG: hypothetical protein NC820_05405 [Candidatus Omnitrophica bacterium]|nr:hypothetical protein [Candidatus Omnitrophota bacterium]